MIQILLKDKAHTSMEAHAIFPVLYAVIIETPEKIPHKSGHHS